MRGIISEQLFYIKQKPYENRYRLPLLLLMEMLYTNSKYLSRVWGGCPKVQAVGVKVCEHLYVIY